MKNIGISLLLIAINAACFGQKADSLEIQVADSVMLDEACAISVKVIPYSIGSSVEFVDSMHFDLLRSRGLTQVLEAESFVSTRSYSPGGIANFSIRGAGAQHTQLLWNGIPINDPMLGQSDLGTIALGGAANLAVLYGSAGLVNTSGGFGGTIAIMSPWASKNDGVSIKLSGYTGSFGTHGVSLQLKDKFRKVFGNTSVEYHIAKNDFSYRNLASIQQERKTMEHARVQRIGFTRRFGFKFTNRNALWADIYISQVNRELPPTMLMAATNEELLDRDIWASLNWQLNTNKWGLGVVASYIYGKQEYLDNNDYTFNHLYQANKNLIRFNFHPGRNLYIGFGVDVFNENAKSDSAYRKEPHWRYWQAAFASLKYVPDKWVSAQALIREDVIDGSFSPVQGLIGVEVKPTKWFFIKGNVARNFRAPTLNDLYWVPGGNPDLKNESGFSWEASLGFRTKSKTVQFKAEGTYFQSEIDNWIIWLPEGSIWTPQNKRAVSSKGVEGRLQTTLSVNKIQFKLNAAYTWVSSTVLKGATQTDASIGKQLIYIPQHQAKANISVHFSRLYLLYGHNYTGMRYTTSDNQRSLPDYQLSYLSLGYTFKFKKHSIGLNFTVDNLFNKSYQSIAWRPMPGRSYLINLNYQFL